MMNTIRYAFRFAFGVNLGMVFMVLEFLQRYSKAYVAHLKTWGFGLIFCMFAPELYLNHND